MGAQQSIAVQRELKQLKDIALLDRDSVMKMIIELNEAGLDLRGREVDNGQKLCPNSCLLENFHFGTFRQAIDLRWIFTGARRCCWFHRRPNPLAKRDSFQMPSQGLAVERGTR